MAFRSKETSGRLSVLIIVALALLLPASAQQQYAVRHQRALWWDKAGTLTVHADGVRFSADSEKPEERATISLDWEQVQQLTLAERSLVIVSYRDVLWQFGRDKQFRFVIPAEQDASFAALAPAVRNALGSRAVIALSGSAEDAEWSIPAKRLGLLRGVEGALVLGGGELRFDAAKPGESRRWPLSEIESVAQTGPLSFTVTAPERALSDMGGYRSFSFALKQPLTHERYQDLWRRIERARGLRLRFHNGQ